MRPAAIERRAGRAQEQRVAPGSAQHLDELEAVDRRFEVRSDGHGTVSLEQGGTGQGLGSLGEPLGDPAGQLDASHLPERHERQSREQLGRLRQRGRVRVFARERQPHRCGEVGMGDSGDVRPGRVDGEVDGEV